MIAAVACALVVASQLPQGPCVGDPRTDILLVGYQASGTPGRDIQTYGPQHGYVSFEGKRYPIAASVHTLSDV